MANNIIAGKLNFLMYSGSQPLRLQGTVQSGELDGTGIFTAARCRLIYATKITGGFDSFVPGSAFSTLQRLEPGAAYAVEAIQSFEFGDSLPHPDPTFKTAVISWVTANKPSSSSNLTVNLTSPAAGALNVAWSSPTVTLTSPSAGALNVAWSGFN